ncbi:UDP-N-acetylmuramate--L-alanine ligase [Actinomyces howellii]|uniref:UDP-N-acetylmuramate--L-alanine ligase n=1 Tax=Actinomyces howellii TaxID=52771 RepID=A0A3S4SM18_9ACTO|nr:UDP-N-acetylmuramate--L-alanine ligase [Actinomyces howellii]VEG26840.1 UDP-N-acetylmuramate--L-alanine ligase [Actinomyces howellii]
MSTTGLRTTCADLAGRSFHLVGVGGAGMSVVALLLAERGAQVSGSDAARGRVLESLRARGVRVEVGHDAHHVPAQATVVVSTAIKEDNPELVVARSRGQEVIHRSQALALAAAGRDFVAVAGAHGKTTTSGMLAQALSEAGQDPSFAVGGVVRALGSGARLGSGRAFVAEADESDRSFLNYAPAIELVTNVEPDHLDSYGSTEAFEQAFADFADRLVPGGVLIACSDDPGALRLARRAGQGGARVITFGTGGPGDLPGGELVGEAHVGVEITARRADSTSAVLRRWTAGPAGAQGTEPVDLELALPGDHVVLDAAGAWAAGLELGVGAQEMARALGAFTGTGRRFEDRGEADGVRVVDDYAHHPTEIEALLRTARGVAADRGGRLLVLFQPHLFSRTRAFAERFGAALGRADLVVVAPVYPAREVAEDFPGVSGLTVAEQVPGGRGQYVADREEAAERLARQARRGDLVLTVGAGDVTELADVVLTRLRAREA